MFLRKKREIFLKIPILRSATQDPDLRGKLNCYQKRKQAYRLMQTYNSRTSITSAYE